MALANSLDSATTTSDGVKKFATSHQQQQQQQRAGSPTFSTTSDQFNKKSIIKTIPRQISNLRKKITLSRYEYRTKGAKKLTFFLTIVKETFNPSVKNNLKRHSTFKELLLGTPMCSFGSFSPFFVQSSLGSTANLSTPLCMQVMCNYNCEGNL